MRKLLQMCLLSVKVILSVIINECYFKDISFMLLQITTVSGFEKVLSLFVIIYVTFSTQPQLLWRLKCLPVFWVTAKNQDVWDTIWEGNLNMTPFFFSWKASLKDTFLIA